MILPTGTRVKSTLTAYKGVITDYDNGTYTVNYDKLGLRKNQPAAHIEPLVKTNGGRKVQTLPVNKDFIDLLRSAATIRVQLPKHKVASFTATYESLTGDQISTDTEHFSVIAEQSKWGVTLTVLIPKEVAALAPEHLHAFQYTHTDENQWAITQNAFVYELFSTGFRLGYNGVTQ